MSDARTTETWTMDAFLQKLKMLVFIVLYEPMGLLENRSVSVDI